MNCKEYGNIRLYNGDCMEYMPELEDNAYELAIVDPPYGIGASGEMGAKECDRWNNPKLTGYKKKEWDNNIPEREYFNELKRVSKNQIIWGANHFSNNIEESRGWIVWDKKRSGNYSKCELAYSSFDKPISLFEYLWNGFQKAKPIKRIHPTQKPVALYRWLLQNYAEEGDKILDTHGGSFSLAIACEMEGFKLDIIELDEDYYNSAVTRFEQHVSQQRLKL